MRQWVAFECAAINGEVVGKNPVRSLTVQILIDSHNGNVCMCLCGRGWTALVYVDSRGRIWSLRTDRLSGSNVKLCLDKRLHRICELIHFVKNRFLRCLWFGLLSHSSVKPQDSDMKHKRQESLWCIAFTDRSFSDVTEVKCLLINHIKSQSVQYDSSLS